MKKLALLLSFVFHPVIFFLLMPYLVIFRQTQNNFYALKWTVFSSIFIVVAIILLLIGRMKGAFSDLDISKREERFKFYFAVYFLALIYLIISLLFKGAFFPLSIIIFGLIFGIVIFDLINRHIKASVHIGVVCAFVLSFSIFYGLSAFLVTFWLVPALFWARIVLKKHTFKEGLIGGFLGCVITICTLLLGKYLYSY